jgi:hypothetical protein
MSLVGKWREEPDSKDGHSGMERRFPGLRNSEFRR